MMFDPALAKRFRDQEKLLRARAARLREAQTETTFSEIDPQIAKEIRFCEEQADYSAQIAQVMEAAILSRQVDGM